MTKRITVTICRYLQGLLHNGFIANGGAEYKGVAISNQYAAISQKKVIDRSILTVTVEDE